MSRNGSCDNETAPHARHTIVERREPPNVASMKVSPWPQAASVTSTDLFTAVEATEPASALAPTFSVFALWSAPSSSERISSRSWRRTSWLSCCSPL